MYYRSENCRIRISVVCQLPKLKRRVRLPYPAEEKKAPKTLIKWVFRSFFVFGKKNKGSRNYVLF